MKWYNPQSEPFKLYGFPFYGQDKVYRRMPLSPSKPLPEAVDGLANETAGGQIRFHAKFKELRIQASLNAKPGFFDHIRAPHTAETTKKSFDLYLSRDGKDFVFIDVSKNIDGTENFYDRRMIYLEEEQDLDVLIVFPSYGGVDKVLIGLNDEAVVSAPWHKFDDDRKIVVYGGSIQQGASASRNGMGMSALLSKWFNLEAYNLGFNSSGKSEPEVAEVIAEIDNPAVLLISTEGNCPSSEWLEEKLAAFIDTYRKKHPETPIVVLPFIVGGKDTFVPWMIERRMKDREIQRKIVDDRKNAGDKNIYLYCLDEDIPKEVNGHSIWHEVTVDGLHYNELGFYWITEGLYKFLKDTVKI